MTIPLGKPQQAEVSTVLEEQFVLIKARTQSAKNNLAIDYGHCHTLVRVIKSMDQQLSKWQAAGMSNAAAGQAWADDRGIVWANVQADFSAFRTALADLITWMTNNKDEFAGPVFDASTGSALFSTPLSPAKDAELLAKLNAILALV